MRNVLVAGLTNGEAPCLLYNLPKLVVKAALLNTKINEYQNSSIMLHDVHLIHSNSMLSDEILSVLQLLNSRLFVHPPLPEQPPGYPLTNINRWWVNCPHSIYGCWCGGF